MTAARHLRLVETTAEVIPMPRKHYDPLDLAGLRLVKAWTVHRTQGESGWVITVTERLRARLATPVERRALRGAEKAGLIAWMPDSTGGQYPEITAHGQVVFDQGAPTGGDAA